MENEKKMIVDALKRYHDTSFTKGVYEHSIFGKAALLLEKDAVDVVRCKDCKHYKEFRTKRNKQIMRLCCRMGKNDMEYPVKPYDFCSFGERRNEDAAD